MELDPKLLRLVQQPCTTGSFQSYLIILKCWVKRKPCMSYIHVTEGNGFFFLLIFIKTDFETKPFWFTYSSV